MPRALERSRKSYIAYRKFLIFVAFVSFCSKSFIIGSSVTLPLECAGMTALWNGETCLAVGKRRHVTALQIFAKIFIRHPPRAVIPRSPLQMEVLWPCRVVNRISQIVNLDAIFISSAEAPEFDRPRHWHRHQRNARLHRHRGGAIFGLPPAIWPRNFTASSFNFARSGV